MFKQTGKLIWQILILSGSIALIALALYGLIRYVIIGG